MGKAWKSEGLGRRTMRVSNHALERLRERGATAAALDNRALAAMADEAVRNALMEDTNARLVWDQMGEEALLVDVSETLDPTLTDETGLFALIKGQGADEAVITFLPRRMAVGMPLRREGEERMPESRPFNPALEALRDVKPVERPAPREVLPVAEERCYAILRESELLTLEEAEDLLLRRLQAGEKIALAKVRPFKLRVDLG